MHFPKACGSKTPLIHKDDLHTLATLTGLVVPPSWSDRPTEKKRKKYQLDNLQNDLQILLAKRTFINNVMNDSIIIYKRKKIDIIKDLLKMNIIQVSGGKVLLKF